MSTQPLTPAATRPSAGTSGPPGWTPQRVPAPGAMASIPNSDRPEVQIGVAFAGGLLVALILKRLVG
jgi:hypothetical protein